MTDRSTTFTVDGQNSEFVYSEANGIFYLTSQRSIKTWSFADPVVRTIYNIGGPEFRQIDISPDGTYMLLVMDEPTVPRYVPAYETSLLRFNLTDYSSDLVHLTVLNAETNNRERGFFDVAILPGDVGLTTNGFAGTGETYLRSFDAAAEIPQFEIVDNPFDVGSITQNSYIVKSEGNRYALLLGGNITGAPIFLYDSKTGNIIAGNGYGGFNGSGASADISETRGLIVQYAGPIWIMDLELNLKQNLTHLVLAGADIAGVQFSEDGNQLFIWDSNWGSDGGSVLVYDTHSWGVVATLDVVIDVTNLSHHGGLNVVAGGELLVLSAETEVGYDYNYEIIDLAARLSLDLSGGAGHDALFGAVGADVLSGAGGNDRLHGGDGADVLRGGAGIDTATYASAQAGVVAKLNLPSHNQGDADGDSYFSIENLTGSRFADVLVGNMNANQLSGGAGGDRLIGGAGDDKLFGGAGRDVLIGGVGRDTFVFNATPGWDNLDRIVDFSVVNDTIQLQSAVFARLGPAGTLREVQFHIGAAAHDANDRIIYNPASGALYYDPDGFGGVTKIQIATLNAGLALTNADFVVI